ncbi:MAG: T9SS type A sorting domain-containing protein [Paludibacteraceae bacterium]
MSGNTQSQILSPAFKLGETSDTNVPKSDSFNIYQKGKHIYISNAYNSSIKLYNMLGNCVATYRGTDHIDATAFPDGVYCIEINDSKGTTLVKKIII